MSKNQPTVRQPNQPGDDPNEFTVAGSDRVYRRGQLLIVLLVPLMMSLLQVSSVNNTLSAIATSIGASDSAQQWVLSGYSLAFGILLIPSGRLGDIFGRSSVFMVGLSVFTVASLLVGLAPNATVLNLLRVLQGIGAGIFSPQVTGLIQQYFTGQARARAFSYFGLVVSMSVAAGPLLSGLFILWLGDDTGWRWSFIINFPIGLLGLYLGMKWLPFGRERRHVGRRARLAQQEYDKSLVEQGQDPETEKKSEKVDLDPVGMLLIAAATLSIMLPFMSDGGLVWLLLPVGVLLLVAWVFWERKYKEHGRFPMVDLELFKIKTFSYSALISALQFLGTTSIFVVLAIFLQQGFQVSAIEVALVSLPNAILSAYAAIWSGKRAYQHGRGLMVFALAIVLFGVLGAIVVVFFMSIWNISFWWLAVPLTFLGFGLGTMGSANQTVSMLDVPAAHGGTAGGVMQTGQRIATAIGNAMVTAIFFAVSAQSSDTFAYYHAISLSYVAIAIAVALALTVAIWFWRDGYHDRHPKQKAE